MVRTFGSMRFAPFASVAFGLTLPWFAVVAQAEPVRLSGGVENRFSDNMRQASTNEESDIETRFIVRAEHQNDPGRCDSNLSGSFAYGYWRDETFDSETYGNLDYLGSCELLDRLYWDVADNLREVRRDTREGDTPDNTTRKNVFQTGPRYSWQVTNRDTINLSGRLVFTEFEAPDENDSERVTTQASWDHLFDPSLAAGIAFEADRAELDNGDEIDRDTISLTFNKRWSVARVNGSVGRSEIESRSTGRPLVSEGVVGNINLDWDVTPSSLYYLKASRELTDQTSDFDIRFGQFEFNLQQTVTVEVTAMWTGLNQSFSNGSALDLGFRASRSDYLQTDFTEYRTGLDASYILPVASNLNANATGSYTYYSFGEDDSEDNTISVDFGLTYQASRKLSLEGHVGHNTRTSSISGREYNENWLMLGVNYQFL